MSFKGKSNNALDEVFTPCAKKDIVPKDKCKNVINAITGIKILLKSNGFCILFLISSVPGIPSIAKTATPNK